MIDTHLTRRRSIALGTGLLTAGAAGLTLGTDPARAAVTTDGLELEDAEFATDGPPEAVWAVLSGTWSYRIDADPDVWEVYLLAYDDSGNSEAIGLADGPATAREDSGTYALRGDLLAASFYDAADFVVPAGEPSRVLTVAVEVAFVLRDAGGGLLIQARAEDAATVTVLPGGTLAQINGGGNIVPQREGEGTPALPEV